MSLDIASEERPVHIPADPERFRFDREVSTIFPNMAVRSIPNFLEAHKAHARMLDPWTKNPAGMRVLDIGASRGAFFDALKEQYPVKFSDGSFRLNAIENSPDMAEYLRNDFPEAVVHSLDITSSDFLTSKEKYDVVCMHYVLQFIPIHQQTEVLLKVIGMVKKGGVLIWGHKAEHYGISGDLAHEEYIKFRVANGYSRAEIEAKTKALQGSMFTMSHYKLLNTLRREFLEVQETFRFMMFSTIFAVK